MTTVPSSTPPGRRRPGVRSAAAPALVPAFVLAVAGGAACTDGSQPAAYDAPRGAQRIITGLGIEVTSDGRRALRVEADSGFVREGSAMVALVGVHAEAFDENQLVRMTLDADSGRLDEETREFVAMGNVRAITRNGTVSVETAHLVFDPSTGRLRTDSSVVVDDRGRVQRGTCFEGDPQLTSWTVCGGGP